MRRASVVICPLAEFLLEFTLGVTVRVTKVGKGGVTTVPHEIRRILGIRDGDSIEWVYEDGKIIMRKLSVAGGSRD